MNNVMPGLLSKKLEYIRREMTELADQDLLFEMDFVVRLMDYLDETNKTGGFNIPLVTTVNGNDEISAKHFQRFQNEFKRFMEEVNISMNETVLAANIISSKLTDMINGLSAKMDSAEQKVLDSEKKVLEKVVDRSIYDSEIKEIDFTRTVTSSNCRITTDNILTLPVVAMKEVSLLDHKITVLSPSDATMELRPTIDNTIKAVNLPTGHWFGSLAPNELGILIRGNEIMTNGTYDAIVKRDPFMIQMLSLDQNASFEAVLSCMPQEWFNECEIIGIGESSLMVGTSSKTLVKNKLFMSTGKDEIRISLKSNNTSVLPYEKVTLVPKNARNSLDNISFNFLESVIFTATSVPSDCIAIKTRLSDIAGVNSSSQTSSRKYDIQTNMQEHLIGMVSFDSIRFSQATYGATGTWQSDMITTDKKIRGIELSDRVSIQDDVKQLVSYSISFNGTDWYGIRTLSSSFARTKDLPIRIELNTNSTRKDYLVLHTDTDYYGFYLMVNLSSTDNRMTPVISELKVRVKVEA